MPQSIIETFKVEATNRVLARIGAEMYDALKFELQRLYGIELAKVTSFSLDELHLALQDLLGPHSARLLVRTIYGEIDRLAKEQARQMAMDENE
ncbi:MAG TPA: hypothetical protein VIB07_07225 [Nitrososphaera sp.]